MQPVIGCDAHKKFSVFVSVDEHGKPSRPVRVDHDRDLYCRYLRSLPEGSKIALEATGHWYWIVDAMEEAGHRPHLANPFEAKRRMAKSNKTDGLNAKGLAILLRCGTLPESWIPPGELRDQSELVRTRMALRDLRTSLKHRIYAAVDRYGLHPESISDLFGTKSRAYLAGILKALPIETSQMVAMQLHAIDQLDEKVENIEQRIADRLKTSPEIRLLRTIPGLGPILAPWYGWKSATLRGSRAPSTWPAMRAWFPASSPAADIFVTTGHSATLITISSGLSSKPPTSLSA